MEKKNSIEIKSIIRHLLFWVAFTLWAFFITHWTHLLIEANETPWQSFLYTTRRIPLIVISTYILIYVLINRFILKEKKYYLFSAYLFLLVITTILLDRFLVKLNYPPEYFEFFNQAAFVRNTYLLLTAMGSASIFRLFYVFIREEGQRHKLKEDYLHSQLSILKAQLNPHFIFNTLNSIYSIAIQNDQKEIAKSLENLSGIMQFLTYEGSSDKTSLAMEMKLIQDFIEIQNLRLSNSDFLTVSFVTKGKNTEQKIAPVILLPLVENAFKHGVLPEEKSFVSIELKAKDDQIDFTVKNSMHKHNKNRKPGIGLSNLKQRLELIYPGEHELTIDQNETEYNSRLVINTKGNEGLYSR